MANPRIRAWGARLGLVALSTTFTLLVLEVAFRFVVPPSTHHLMYEPSDDPEIGVRLRPNADFEFRGVSVPIPPSRVKTSRQGLRDDPVAIPAPPGVRRLLCVGDSTTFGWGVEREQTFCHRLQDLLGAGWETVNLGVPGYNPTQEVRRLETLGLQLEPAVVVLLLQSNDYEAPLAWGDADSLSGRLVRHSALVRWVRVQLARNEPTRSSDGPQKAIAAFERLAELARERRFSLLVLTPTADSHREITRALDERGIPRAPVDAAFAGQPELTIPGDGHPNPEGHRRLAEHIAALLRDRGLAAR